MRSIYSMTIRGQQNQLDPLLAALVGGSLLFLPFSRWKGRCGNNGHERMVQSRTSRLFQPEQSRHMSLMAAGKDPFSAWSMMGSAILGKRSR
jgi:hypothetical protein